MEDRIGRPDIEGVAPNESVALFELDADARFLRHRRISLDSSLGIEEEEASRPPSSRPRT